MKMTKFHIRKDSRTSCRAVRWIDRSSSCTAAAHPAEKQSNGLSHTANQWATQPTNAAAWDWQELSVRSWLNLVHFKSSRMTKGPAMARLCHHTEQHVEDTPARVTVPFPGSAHCQPSLAHYSLHHCKGHLYFFFICQHLFRRQPSIHRSLYLHHHFIPSNTLPGTL